MPHNCPRTSGRRNHACGMVEELNFDVGPQRDHSIQSTHRSEAQPRGGLRMGTEGVVQTGQAQSLMEGPRKPAGRIRPRKHRTLIYWPVRTKVVWSATSDSNMTKYWSQCHPRPKTHDQRHLGPPHRPRSGMERPQPPQTHSWIKDTQVPHPWAWSQTKWPSAYAHRILTGEGSVTGDANDGCSPVESRGHQWPK